MRPWTVVEVRVIRAYAPLGARAIASILERSPQAIRSIAANEGISLRETGEDVEVNAEALNLVERLKETPGLSVCPMCGKRWARMKNSGMCRSCHLDGLLDLHQERLDEEIRLKKLDKARQDKRRLRVCARCGQPFFPRPSSTDDLCGECS